jgi:hypothetical protein
VGASRLFVVRDEDAHGPILGAGGKGKLRVDYPFDCTVSVSIAPVAISAATV